MSLEAAGSVQSIQQREAEKEIASLTNGIKSLTLSGGKKWQGLSYDMLKHIAGFLTTKETVLVFQRLERRVAHVIKDQTAPVQLTERETRHFTLKLLQLTADSKERPYLAAIAQKVIHLKIGKRSVQVNFKAFWYKDAELTKLLPFFTNLQTLECGHPASGGVFSVLPPTLKTLKIDMKLTGADLKTLSLHPALNHLIFDSATIEGLSSFNLPPSIHTLELDQCQVLEHTRFGWAYHNLCDDIGSLSTRFLKLRFNVFDYLAGRLLGTNRLTAGNYNAISAETYKAIARKVTHLNLEGGQIDEDRLIKALAFFENLQELILPQEFNADCLHLSPSVQVRKASIP